MSNFYSINYNGIDSYFDLGLRVEQIPPIPIPCELFKEIPIEGRATTYEHLGEYENIEIPIKFVFKEISDINNREQEIKRAFINKVGILKLSTNLDVYLKVKNIMIQPIQRKMTTLFTMDIIFICDAYQYLNDGLNEIELNHPGSLHNNFFIDALSDVYIYGQGDGTLNINDDVINIKGLNGCIFIDGNKKESFENFKRCDYKIKGHYPKLSPGENTIHWGGGITKVKVIPHWRTL